MIASVTLGYTKSGQRISLSPEEREYNVHLIGLPKSGKSKLLASMVQEDILSGQGVCVIDPHGTLYEEVVEWCAAEGVDEWRTIRLIDPKDDEWSVGFNPLDFRVPADVPENERPDLAKGVNDLLGTFSQVWGGEDLNETPRLKRMLRNLLYLLAHSDLTLLEAHPLLGLPGRGRSEGEAGLLRKYLSQTVRDPIFGTEWDELLKWSRQEFSDKSESTLNRLTEFIALKAVRRMLGQQQDTIDFRNCMDEQEVVLVNLGQDEKRLDKLSARLIGTLLLNDIVRKAWGRPKATAEKAPFFIYLDECYRFLGDDAETILDELRKFGIFMTVAHQRLWQLEKHGGESVKDAVMGIAQNKVMFRVSAKDATELAEDVFMGEFDHQKVKDRLTQLETYDEELVWVLGMQEGQSVTYDPGSNTVSVTETVSETVNEDGEVIAKTVGESSSSSSTFPRTIVSEQESQSAQQVQKPKRREIRRIPYTHEELVNEAAASLKNQRERHAVVKIPGKKSCQITTPEVSLNFCEPDGVRQFRQDVFRKCARPVEVVDEEITRRLTVLRQGAELFGNSPEPHKRGFRQTFRDDDDKEER